MSIFFVDLRYNGVLWQMRGSPLPQLFDLQGGNAMQTVPAPIQPPIFFKNPTVATLLSLVTGLGQLYNGQIFKGIAFFGSMVISWLLTWVFIGFILIPIVWILGMVDANSSAKKINRRLMAGASSLQTAQ